MKTITVKVKRAWGQVRYYPTCDFGRLFCALLNHKSLTKNDIDLIKRYNFEVKIEED